MANVKFSSLSSMSTLDGTEELVGLQGGVAKTGTVAQVEAYVETLLPAYRPPVVVDNNTTRTLSTGDNGKYLYFTSASSITLSMDVGLGVRFGCTVIQGGAGQITFASNGQSMTVANGATKTAGAGAMATIFAPVANTFFISGVLA